MPLYPHILVIIVITRNASRPVGIYWFLEGFVGPGWCRCVSPISPSLTQLVYTLSFGLALPSGVLLN